MDMTPHPTEEEKKAMNGESQHAMYQPYEPSLERLRDEFAMAALTGLLASDVDLNQTHEAMADMAYLQAEAMLKRREDPKTNL